MMTLHAGIVLDVFFKLFKLSSIILTVGWTMEYSHRMAELERVPRDESGK